MLLLQNRIKKRIQHTRCSFTFYTFIVHVMLQRCQQQQSPKCTYKQPSTTRNNTSHIYTEAGKTLEINTQHTAWFACGDGTHPPRECDKITWNEIKAVKHIKAWHFVYYLCCAFCQKTIKHASISPFSIGPSIYRIYSASHSIISKIHI